MVHEPGNGDHGRPTRECGGLQVLITTGGYLQSEVAANGRTRSLCPAAVVMTSRGERAAKLGSMPSAASTLRGNRVHAVLPTPS
jgi:hypothetical protein